MKKYISILTTIVIVLALIGCRNTSVEENSNTINIEENLIENPQEISDDTIEIGNIDVVASGISGADGIVVDYSGNIFVGSRNTNTIYKIDQAGNVTDFAKVPCEELLCMTIDKENSLYVAGKDKLVKIDKKGDIETLASDFTCADDVRLDLEGNIYVTDSFENRVYKVTPDLQKSIFIDSDIDQNRLFRGWYITGLTFDKDYQNLYIAKMKQGLIMKYPLESDGTAGEPETVISGLLEPDHLELDSKGNIYITIFRDGSLVRLDLDGNIQEICTKAFGYATGIAFGKIGDDRNYVYIADYQRGIVYRVFVGEEAAF
ncbi:SMP-30/gluconolactonase/LRE family protein [Mycoplasmatota bacterium zrk1]